MKNQPPDEEEIHKWNHRTKQNVLNIPIHDNLVYINANQDVAMCEFDKKTKLTVPEAGEAGVLLHYTS